MSKFCIGRVVKNDKGEKEVRMLTDCDCDCREKWSTRPMAITRESPTNYWLALVIDKKTGEAIGWRCKRCGHIQSEIAKDAIELHDEFYEKLFPKSFKPTGMETMLTKAR